MKEGYNGTREISIVDMLLYICQRWRSIIICMVIGAVVLGGYNVYKTKSATAVVVDAVISEAEAATAVTGLSENDITRLEMIAERIEKNEQLIAAQKKFNEESMFMNLDPYNVVVHEIKYYINNYYSGDGTNYQANAIAEAYGSALKSRGFGVDMEDALLGSSDETLLSYTYNNIIRVDSGSATSGILTITILGNTKENAAKIAEIVKKTMNDAYGNITSAIGGYSVGIIGESARTCVDTTIADEQLTALQKVIDLSNNIIDLKNNITDPAQKTYLNFLLQNGENFERAEEAMETIEEVTSEGQSISLRALLKYGILGLFLGAILAGLFYILRYVILGTLMMASELTDAFGIQVLGTFDVDTEFNKKRQTKLDKWLLSLRYKSKNRLSYEESVKMVSAKIQISAEKNGLKNVCLALSPNLTGNHSFVDDIQKALEGKTNVTVVSNIIGAANALNDMSAGDAVVLIEQLEVSKHKDVYSECMLCSTYGVSIIGAVIVE